MKVVGAIVSLPQHQHGTKVSWCCLATNVRVNAQVANEDEVARLKVIVVDCSLVVLFELLNGGKLTLQNVVMNGSKVFRLLLKLTSIGGDELCCREGLSKIWDKEGGKSKVKGKDGFHPMRHIKGGESCRSAYSDMISPKNMQCTCQPL